MIITLQGGGRLPIVQLPDTRLTGDSVCTQDVVLIRMTQFLRTNAARDYGEVGAIPVGVFSALDRNYRPPFDRVQIRVVRDGMISEGRAAPDMVAREDDDVSPDPRYSFTGVVDPLAFWRACMLVRPITDRAYVYWLGFEPIRPDQVAPVQYAAELLTPGSPHWDAALGRRAPLHVVS